MAVSFTHMPRPGFLRRNNKYMTELLYPNGKKGSRAMHLFKLAVWGSLFVETLCVSYARLCIFVFSFYLRRRKISHSISRTVSVCLSLKASPSAIYSLLPRSNPGVSPPLHTASLPSAPSPVSLKNLCTLRDATFFFPFLGWLPPIDYFSGIIYRDYIFLFILEVIVYY